MVKVFGTGAVVGMHTTKTELSHAKRSFKLGTLHSGFRLAPPDPVWNTSTGFLKVSSLAPPLLKKATAPLQATGGNLILLTNVLFLATALKLYKITKRKKGGVEGTGTKISL